MKSFQISILVTCQQIHFADLDPFDPLDPYIFRLLVDPLHFIWTSSYCSALSQVPLIVVLIQITVSMKGSKAEILLIDFDNVQREEVKFLPPAYDEDIIFELPPLMEGCAATYGRYRQAVQWSYLVSDDYIKH